MRFWKRRERREVVIDPVQLEMIRFLLRFGAATQDVIYEEVRNTSVIPREMFTTAVADAAAQDLVDYRFVPERDETLVVLTQLGTRLKGRLPESSRSRMSIYL